MGFFKKTKRKVLKIGATVRHKARKTPLAHYAPAFGSERTLAGTKLSPKAKKALRKEKSKSRKKDKRTAKKIWRKLI